MDLGAVVNEMGNPSIFAVQSAKHRESNIVSAPVCSFRCELLTMALAFSPHARSISTRISAASSGARVLVLERTFKPGGQLVKQTHMFFGSESQYASHRGVDIAGILLKKVEEFGDQIEIMLNCTAVGFYEDNVVTVLKEEKDYFKVKAQAVICYYLIKGEVSPNWSAWLLIPLILVHLGIMGMGFGIIVSSMTTKYRDLSVLVGFGMHLWMYGTPVVYPLSQLTRGWMRMAALINPVTAPVELFRFILLGEGLFIPASCLWRLPK